VDWDELSTAIHHYLTTSTGSLFAERTVTLLEQWTGADNLLWRVECAGQEAVLKYYLDAGQVRGRRQFDGQERFHALGIAPQPLWFDRYPTGLSRQVLVYQWQPGAPLTTPTDAQLTRFAQTVAQVHNADPSDVQRFSPNPLNLDYLWKILDGGLPPLYAWLQAVDTPHLMARLQQLAEEGAALVQATLPLWQGVAPTPVHGDLKLENVLDSLGNVLLLDWELFGLGDAAYDVALFLQMNQALLATDAQELWLESYLATIEQPGIEARIGVYTQLLPLQNLSFLLHGLRRSTPADQAALLDNQEFLRATLVATIDRAVLHLGGDPSAPSAAATLDAELAKLFVYQ
jgi:thiamine kinase-like enzyme